MPAIDAHTHAFPDELAKRAIEKLQAQAAWKAVGKGTVKDLLRAMDHAGVDMAVVCAIATRPGQVEGILQWEEKVLAKHGDRLLPFASIHPGDDDPIGWMERFVEAGLEGVKLHPFYQDFVVDDPAVRPVFEAAAETGMMVSLHGGCDVGFEADPMPDRAAPARTAKLLRAVPFLRLLVTHMGGWKMWDQVEQHLLGEDVYLETSFWDGFLPPEQLLRIIQVHGADRVCFGTDWPWNRPDEQIAKLRSLGLGEKELDAVLFGTAARLLRL